MRIVLVSDLIILEYLLKILLVFVSFLSVLMAHTGNTVKQTNFDCLQVVSLLVGIVWSAPQAPHANCKVMDHTFTRIVYEEKETEKCKESCEKECKPVCHDTYQAKCETREEKTCVKKLVDECRDVDVSTCEEYPERVCIPTRKIEMVDVIKTVWVKETQKKCKSFWTTNENNVKIWVEDPNNCDEYLTDVAKNITQMEPRHIDTTECNMVTKTRTNIKTMPVCEKVYKSDCTKTVTITTCMDVKETKCQDFGAKVTKKDCVIIHEKIPKMVKEVRQITVCE